MQIVHRNDAKKRGSSVRYTIWRTIEWLRLLSLSGYLGLLVSASGTTLNTERFPVLAANQQSRQGRSDILDLFGMPGFAQPVSSPSVSLGAG